MSYITRHQMGFGNIEASDTGAPVPDHMVTVSIECTSRQGADDAPTPLDVLRSLAELIEHGIVSATTRDQEDH